jgi:hypothetical protein
MQTEFAVKQKQMEWAPQTEKLSGWQSQSWGNWPREGPSVRDTIEPVEQNADQKSQRKKNRSHEQVSTDRRATPTRSKKWLGSVATETWTGSEQRGAMAGSRNKNERLRIQLRQARGRKDRTKTPHLGLPKSLTDRDRREKLGEREFWRQEKISSKTKILTRE